MRINKIMECYNEQKKHIESYLRDGEQICHCIDEQSFGGRYYNPNWVVTSAGRIYSLVRKHWISPFLKSGGRRNKAGEYPRTEYYVKIGKRDVKFSRLIANYFCDKTLIQRYGEECVDVHHIVSFDSKLSCEENNCAGNLQYALNKKGEEKSRAAADGVLPHEVASKIQRGVKINNFDTDVLFGIVMRSVPGDKKSEVELLNDGGIRIKAHFGGTMTEREAEEYAVRFAKKKDDFYYVREDGTTHYGRL